MCQYCMYRIFGYLNWVIGELYDIVVSINPRHDSVLGFCLPSVVTNVKRTKSILLSKEKLCLYIHESLEHHGSPWKLTIANTSGGGGGE